MIEQITARFERDDRAVSPVIGVILMVAITVILAAVIGTFVLDLGSNVGESAPQASLAISDHNDDYPTSENTFRVNHDGGEDLAFDQLRIEVRNANSNALILQFDGDPTAATGGTGDGNVTLNGAAASSTDLMSTGDQIVIVDTNSDDFSDGTQYRVMFIDKNGGEQVASGTVTLR